MTDFYKTGIFNIDHSTFGGIIYPSDFETTYRGNDNLHGSTIAQRIISDKKFDKHYRKIIERKNEINKTVNGGN